MAHARSALATPSPASRSASSSASSASTRAATASERARERRDETVGDRQQRPIADESGRQALDARGALGALARGPLGHAALGGELALDLRAAHGGLALVGRLAALVDEPRRAALLLDGLRPGAIGVAQGAIGLVARRVGRLHGRRGGLDGGQRALLGLHGALGLAHERIAPVALGQHALRAAARRLAQLAGEAEPRAAAARDGHAQEAGRQLIEVLDHPRVGQQPARELHRGRRPA